MSTLSAWLAYVKLRYWSKASVCVRLYHHYYHLCTTLMSMVLLSLPPTHTRSVSDSYIYSYQHHSRHIACNSVRHSFDSSILTTFRVCTLSVRYFWLDIQALWVWETRPFVRMLDLASNESKFPWLSHTHCMCVFWTYDDSSLATLRDFENSSKKRSTIVVVRVWTESLCLSYVV